MLFKRILCLMEFELSCLEKSFIKVDSLFNGI